MLLLLYVLFVMVCLFIGGVSFIIWVSRQASQARKYRYLMKEQAATIQSNVAKVVSGPAWKIVYRVGTKKREGVFTGATEKEALLSMVKTCGVGYGSIVSSTKVN